MLLGCKKGTCLRYVPFLHIEARIVNHCCCYLFLLKQLGVFQEAEFFSNYGPFSCEVVKLSTSLSVRNTFMPLLVV